MGLAGMDEQRPDSQSENVPVETEAEREAREREEARVRERQERHDRARDTLRAFEGKHTEAHHEAPRPASPPRASEPPVDHKRLVKRERAKERKERGIPFYAPLFQRSAWQEVKEAADARATARGGELERERELKIKQRQEELDADWERLLENDPEVVRGAVLNSLDSPDLPVVSVTPEGEHVSVVVRVPPRDSIVPTDEPGETSDGLPSVERIPADRRDELHAEAVASHLLATARRVLSTLPKVTSTRVSAVMIDGAHLVPVYDGEFERAQCADADWDAGALTLSDRLGARLGTRGQAPGVSALSLADDPDSLHRFEAAAKAADRPLDPRARR